jgi:hypothetical protein
MLINDGGQRGVVDHLFYLIHVWTLPTKHERKQINQYVSYLQAVCLLPSKLDVHGSVHRNIKLIERTKKMLPCSRIYYSIVS